MLETARQVWTKLRRDGDLPLRMRVRKGLVYLGGLAGAPLFLAGATEVGRGVRAVGRPRVENYGRLIIGDGTLVRSVTVPVELACGPGAELILGKDVRLNYGVSIGATRSITIGDRCRIGPYVMIIDTEYHDVYDREKRPPARPVVLEHDVWVAAKSTVLPGVHVGAGAVVGVGSVVTADVEPYTVVAGNPARLVRRLDPARFVPPPEEPGSL